eukprot:1161789-Pelagomonas_calceolata.AAC.7
MRSGREKGKKDRVDVEGHRSTFLIICKYKEWEGTGVQGVELQASGFAEVGGILVSAGCMSAQNNRTRALPCKSAFHSLVKRKAL